MKWRRLKPIAIRSQLLQRPGALEVAREEVNRVEGQIPVPSSRQ